MQRNTNWPDIEESAAPLIRGALDRLETAKDELTLDLSGVRRIDSAALRELAQLAEKARARSITVVLHGVHVEVYKVLKLMALTGQFSFA
jgi:anti-anti-sigma factor